MNMEEIINSGDPVVRTWFLVEQTYVPLILCTCYAIFSTKIGPAMMKNRKPFDLRMPMIIFNFAVVATYLIALVLIFDNLPKLTWKEFCFGGVVKYGQPTYLLARCGWLLYIIKYCEFLDTVFFVLRKKQNLITFLHVIHHTVVPLIAWMLLRTERSGMPSIPVIANAVVHVFMYTYYGLAAIGPEFRKYLWWKKYITQLQMFQFIFIMLFVSVVVPLSGCSMVHTSYLMNVSVAALFFSLFYRYYQATFVAKATQATNGAAKKELITKNGLLRKGEEKREMMTNGRSRKEE